jgi:hypothetical protein
MEMPVDGDEYDDSNSVLYWNSKWVRLMLWDNMTEKSDE